MSNKRFFSEKSFWNQAIDSNARKHKNSDKWIAMLDDFQNGKGMHINLHEWTIPVYFVDESVPKVPVGKRFPDWESSTEYFSKNSKAFFHTSHPMGHGPGFAEVPIPEYAIPDPAADSHLAIIDKDSGQVWDMWACRKRSDGNWESCTGMTYSLDDEGVFDPKLFDIHNGESIHLYGPSRASGVPIIAGLIMKEEVNAGHINHKLAFATGAAGLLEHIFPATWTDGGVPGGVPEGALLQLDPQLDLSSFNLNKNAKVVLRAMQEYGAVLTDIAGSVTLYGEGLWSRKKQDGSDETWQGLLEESDLQGIPWKHYRIVETFESIEKGMVPLAHHGAQRQYHKATGVPVFK